jgi:hypothetical protein
MVSKLMRSVLCLVLLFGVVTMTVDAANKSRIGTAGAQELLIPVGARGVAIGPSSMVFAKGAEAIYWNPAGLSRADNGVEAMVSTMSYIADINVLYGAIGVKAGDFGSVGFSLKSIGFGDIPVTTENFPDGTGATYSPTFLNFGVTYSKLLTDRIAVGLTTTLVSERVMDLSATGVAFNLGIQYKNLAIDGLNIGLAVKNIGGSMQFSGSNLLKQATTGEARGTQWYTVQAAAFEMPSSMEIGMSYARSFDEKTGIEIGGLFRNNNFQDDEYSFGGEFNFANTFFVRGGYVLSPQTDKDVTGVRSYIYDFTVGVGVETNAGGVNLAFDYAYRHMKYFESSNVVTMRVGF